MIHPVTFSSAGLRRGAGTMVPLLPAVVVFAATYGFVARQQGLSVLETVAMSALVFAGAAQMVAVQLWQHPPPLVELTVAAAVVNLRYLIMAPVLKDWLAPLGGVRTYASLFLTTDENWAVSVAEMRRGGRDAAFFVGSGLALWVPWVLFSAVGRLGGGLIPATEPYGLDFIGTAVFLALLLPLWQGRRSLLPWIAAAAAALLAERLLAGAWYLLLGGLAGSLVGAAMHVRR